MARSTSTLAAKKILPPAVSGTDLAARDAPLHSTADNDTVREHEQRLAAIFAGAAAGLCEISLTGEFEHVNDELCRMLGRSREGLLGTSLLEVVHPDEVVVILRAIAQTVSGNERVSIDTRWLRPAGQTVWVNTRFTRLDDAQRRARALLVVSIDLTSRREIERALRDSEARFRTLAEASPAVIWCVDADGGIRYVNQRYLEFFGQSEAEVLGHGWLPPVHPDDAHEYTGEMLAALRARRPLSCRARFQRHDGEWRWLESQALPHFGEDDRYLGHVGHSLDITEFIETTHALRQSQDRLRRAMDIDTVGIVFFNTGGLVTESNEAFLQMSGYTRQDVAEGRVHIDSLAAPEYRSRARGALNELAAVGRTFPFEQECLRKDGMRWWGLFAATRLSPVEAVQFVVDITARKRSEEELVGYHEQLEERVLHRTAELDAVNGTLRDEIIERSRAEQGRQELLRQLVSAQEDERRRISRELHDQIGQDLTALMLGLKALERPDGRPPSRDELQRLQALTQNIGKQVHDMALELRPTALDDLGLLRTLSNYLEDWSKRTNIEVDFHSSGWKGERLSSPIETTIYRIVREALNNIVKHAEAAHVSVIIERHVDQVVAIVEDDGKGFDPEGIPARATPRLGLVGMRERAALAGGELSIESRPGGGTTVFVRLPLNATS